MLTRKANLTPDVRIYGANAQEIALRYRDEYATNLPLGRLTFTFIFKM